MLDTRELFSALEGESFANQSKLERVCRLLGFKPEYLHNAGNDAHVRPLFNILNESFFDVERD